MNRFIFFCLIALLYTTILASEESKARVGLAVLKLMIAIKEEGYLSNSGIIQAMERSETGDFVEFEVVAPPNGTKAHFRFAKMETEWVGSYQFPRNGMYYRLRNIAADSARNQITFEECIEDDVWRFNTLPKDQEVILIGRKVTTMEALQSSSSAIQGGPQSGRVLYELLKNKVVGCLKFESPKFGEGNQLWLMWDGRRYVGAVSGNCFDEGKLLWAHLVETEETIVLVFFDGSICATINSNDMFYKLVWISYKASGLVTDN